MNLDAIRKTESIKNIRIALLFITLPISLHRFLNTQRQNNVAQQKYYKDSQIKIVMPPIKKNELKKRYVMYRKKFRELKKTALSTREAILRTALEFNVGENTIRNAIRDRPMNCDLKKPKED